ncbi:MAG: ABC transporter substrate-binding protein, partial [Myxococcales bacterium]|nr:ABC transporter substrate-binding protein [Myxococcales bacterium]
MPTLKLTDDLGRTLSFGRAPRRIVSLVPSDTYSVLALGAADRLVGRTIYCDLPQVAAVPTIGGTKDVDVEAVVALEPDLVIANQEENTRVALEALAARVPVLVSLPRRV